MMSKKILILLSLTLLFSLSLSRESRVSNYKSLEKYFTKGIQGFWTGFQRGFYDNTTISLHGKCMNDEAVKQIDFISNYIDGYIPIFDIPYFVTSSIALINNNF